MDAIADPPVFDRARAALAYRGVASRLARGLKFSDRTEIAPLMARWMMRVGIELAKDAEMVVPVPLHPLRQLHRRYNQSAELARAFSACCQLPFHANLVKRKRMTRQQVGLAASQRAANVRGAFQVPKAARPLVKGRRILVIDDVYTTGATVSAVARALRRSGARSVDVLTFARVLPEEIAV